MKILVIGGSGVIGSSVVAECRRNEHEVITASPSHGDIVLDITSLQSIRNMYSQLGHVDAVIITCGKVHFGTIGKLEHSLGIQDKLMGQINVVEEGIQHLSNGGVFVLTSGILNHHTIESGISASMVNGALNAYVHAAARYLPHNLRINIISPTLVKESIPRYGSYFPGFPVIPAADLARVYCQCLAGQRTGTLYLVGYNKTDCKTVECLPDPMLMLKEETLVSPSLDQGSMNRFLHAPLSTAGDVVGGALSKEPCASATFTIATEGSFFAGPSKTNILVLGSGGNMGPAVVKFLCEMGYTIIAADLNAETNRLALLRVGLHAQIEKKQVLLLAGDASSVDSIQQIILEHNPAVVVSLLPPGQLASNAIQATINERRHYVSCNFLSSEQKEAFSKQAKESGKVICCENGLDPGLGEFAIKSMLPQFESIYSIKYFGAGLPTDPKQGYVHNWTGYIKAYGDRVGVLAIGAADKKKEIPAHAKFNREHVFLTTLNDGNQYEAYVNGQGGLLLRDWLRENSRDIDLHLLDIVGTYSLRHIGHCDFWRPALCALDLLNSCQIILKEGSSLSPRSFLEQKIREQNAGGDKSFADNPDMQLAVRCLHESTCLSEAMAEKSDFWKEMKRLGFFNTDTNITATGRSFTARDIVSMHLERQYTLGDHDEFSSVYIEIEGIRRGEKNPSLLKTEVTLKRDFTIGLTSMQIAVAGILAFSTKMVLTGKIAPGLYGALDNPCSDDILRAFQARFQPVFIQKTTPKGASESNNSAQIPKR